MFELGFSELLLIAVVAIVVIGPKDLPRALSLAGKWVGKARAMSRNLRAGFDAMVRESELQELEKQWAEQNRRIMAEHGVVSGETGEPVMQPLPAPPPAATDTSAEPDPGVPAAPPAAR